MGAKGIWWVIIKEDCGRMDDYKKHYEGKVVLVTGGAGAIGSNLTRVIAELNARTVIVFDNMSAAYEWNIPSLHNVLFVKGSVTDEVALKRVFNLKPDIVYHLAAFFANQNSVDFPQHDLMTNGLGTLLVYQYAQMCGTGRWCMPHQVAQYMAQQRHYHLKRSSCQCI